MIRYMSSLKLIALLALLVLLQAEIVPFDNSAIDAIFQQKKSALFLFLGDEAAEADAHEALKAYDETSPDLVLTLSTKNDGHGLFERLAEYLGVNTDQTPAVLLLKDGSEKYRFEGEAVTAEELISFVGKVNSGEIKPFLKSAAIPGANEDPVKVVVGKTFEKIVMRTHQEVLVKFYAPWCGHCKHLAPHYDEAARRLANNPNVLLVKVDSTENEVAGSDVQGFPTLKFYRKDKEAEPLEFNGGRDAEGIINWIKENTEYPWVEPLPAGGEEAEEEPAAPEEEL
jgi:protein disulfide-isomerase A1